MERWRLSIGFTLLILILISNAKLVNGAEKHIFIDASATEGGIGSWSAPYNEFSDINWESGGDNSISDWVKDGHDVHIRLRRGETWNEKLRVLTSGKSGHPIVIEPYGTGIAPVIDKNGVQACLDLYNKKHIVINGIAFQKAANAIFLSESSHITIRKCTFQDTYTGVYIRGRNRFDAHDILIENCTFSNIAEYAISGVTRGWGNQAGKGNGTIYALTVRDNDFTDVKSAISLWGDKNDVTSHGGISPYKIVIEDNIIMNTRNAAIFLNSGTRKIGSGSFIRRNVLSNIGLNNARNVNALQLNWCRGLVVEDNSIDTVNTNIPDGAGIILDWAWRDSNYLSNGVIVRRNTLRNCVAEGKGKGIDAWKATNSKIHNNLIVNSSRGIKVSNPETTGTKCYVCVNLTPSSQNFLMV